MANLRKQVDVAEATGRCNQCGKRLTPKRYGPPAKYCSANCRGRAKYERSRSDGRYAQGLAGLRANTQAKRQANARPCPYCGGPMIYPFRVQCGAPECKRLWTNERNLAFQREHKARTGQYYSHQYTYSSICRACGKTWGATTRRAMYCSVGCANTARSYERTCEDCGKTWHAKQATGRWCSAQCGARSRYWARRRPPPPPSTDLILRRRRPWWAGRVWTPPRPLRRRWYIGQCQRCGQWVVSDQPRNRYCSTSCLRLDCKVRRRAVKRDAYVADVSRIRIFERDRWICQLCRRKTQRTATAPHPLAPVLDHVIPLSVGGTHEPANVQCAHFLCNSVKSNRGGGEQLMLLG